MPAHGGFCVAALETGKVLSIYEGNIGNGRWGPAGRRLTFWHTAAQAANVQVWDRITGAMRTYMSGEPTSSEAWISPDGQVLYSASRNDSLMKVSLDTGELIERIPLPGRPLTTIFVGDQVLVLYHDRTADVWDIARGQKLARHDRSDLNPLARALDPNGAFVIWETTSGVLEKVVFDGSDGWTVEIPSEPQNIKLSRSGQWVVTLDGEQMARVYATRTGVLVMEETFEGNAPSVDFSSSGDRMLLLTDRGEVRVYRLRDGAILSVLQLERGAEIVRARFDNDQSIITVSKDLVARTWSIPHEPPDPGTISNLRPCADGRLIPVTPWPDADAIWAPEAQCASPVAVSQN